MKRPKPRLLVAATSAAWVGFRTRGSNTDSRAVSGISGPLIVDREQDMLALVARRYGDRGVRASVLYGIRDQVRYDLFQPISVPLSAERARSVEEHDPIGVMCLRLLDHLLTNSAQVGRPRGDRNTAAETRARQIQKIADQPIHASEAPGRWPR